MNSIQVIHPYKYKNTWMFDDPTVGLVREPFVAGADNIIDTMVKNITNAHTGFTLIFSAMPFPGHQYVLEWQWAESKGNWYFIEATDELGWLCPALMKYFDEVPKKIYVQVKGAE